GICVSWNPGIYSCPNRRDHCRLDRCTQAKLTLGLFLYGACDAGHLCAQFRLRPDACPRLFAVTLLVTSVAMGRIPESQSYFARINAVGGVHGLHRSIDARPNARSSSL